MAEEIPDDERLDPRLLDAYEVPDVPADLADRVLQALSAGRAAEQRAQPRPPRWRFAAVAVAVAVVTVVGFVRLGRRPGPAAGARELATRESLLLGTRGVAVGEAGAALSWAIAADGSARVEQTRGDVFYRVERGGAFVVSTPAGDVTVQGTCFRVEVSPMRVSKDKLVGAAIGAAAAVTVLVSVYEGRVLLANERGRQPLVAGERAEATAASAPRPFADRAEAGKSGSALDSPPADGITTDELLRRDQAQRDAVAQLRGKVKGLEAQIATAGSPSDKHGREETFVDPPKEELLELAKKCRLAYDTPSVSVEPSHFGDNVNKDFGLTPEERAQLNKAASEFNNKILGEMRALYSEATGDTRTAEMLSPSALEAEIASKSGTEEERQQIFQRLSQERAGLLRAPDDLKGASTAERYFRLITRMGDSFERTVGQVVGPDRAHEIRAKNNGWGNRHGSSYGCPKQ